MFESNFDSKKTDTENDKKIEQSSFEEIESSDEDLEKIIEALLIKPKKEDIGSGRAANVFIDPQHPEICYKVIYDDSQNIDPKKEIDFLEKVSSLNGDVRVPEPLFPISKSSEKEGENNTGISAFAMKRINGMSVENMINENRFPDGVKVESMDDFKKLRQSFRNVKEFVRRMNEELKIMHKDLFPGNIMLDEDGSWWIIDFGRSKQEYFQEDITNEDTEKLTETWKSFESSVLKYVKGLQK